MQCLPIFLSAFYSTSFLLSLSVPFSFLSLLIVSPEPLFGVLWIWPRPAAAAAAAAAAAEIFL